MPNPSEGVHRLTQGTQIPAWRTEQIHNIAQRITPTVQQWLTRQRYTPTFEQQQSRIADLRRQYGALERGADGVYEVEIIPGEEPIDLTAKEIITLQRDTKLVAKTIQRYTGKKPTLVMVQQLQHTLQEEYGGLLRVQEEAFRRMVPPEAIAEGAAPAARRAAAMEEATARDVLTLQSPLTSAEQQSLLKRAELPRREAAKIHQWARIALMTASQREADRMYREAAAQTAPRARLMQQQLQQLQTHDPRQSIFQDLEDTKRQDLGEYMQPYEDIIRQMQAEGEERWKEQIAPRISANYALHGAAYSGTHAAYLNKAYQRHMQDTAREISKIRLHAYESARDAADRQQSHALQRAHVRSSAEQIQTDRYVKAQEALAAQMANYQHDPIRNWMGHMGAQLLQAGRESPLQAIGKASVLSLHDKQFVYDKSMHAKHLAANLYTAMNHSLQNQQHFLADYEAKRVHYNEMERHNRAIEAKGAHRLQGKSTTYLKQFNEGLPSLNDNPAAVKLKLDALKKDLELAQAESLTDVQDMEIDPVAFQQHIEIAPSVAPQVIQPESLSPIQAERQALLTRRHGKRI